MIYQNSDIEKLPDSKAMRRMLLMMQDKIPVLHLMPFEKMVGDEGAYILTRLSNGRFSIKPNITHQGLLYYGNCDFEKVKEDCKPRYYRRLQNGYEPGHDEFMEYNVLLEQFRMLVESFPLYRLLNEGIDINSRLKIRVGNSYALASAYGLKTPYMNLTSDIDVAMFYATHKYDAETDKFVAADENSVGVVYAYCLPIQFGMIHGLSTLGKQVFPHTFFNKQFLLFMNKNDNFNNNKMVNGFTFRQTSEGSKFYANKFADGEKLLPHDDFLVKKLKSDGKVISREALLRNLKNNPKDDIETNSKILKNNGYKILEEIPKFQKDDLLNVDLMEIWEKICEDLIPRGSVRYDGDIKEFFEQVPYMDKYKSFFDMNLYYER